MKDKTICVAGERLIAPMFFCPECFEVITEKPAITFHTLPFVRFTGLNNSLIFFINQSALLKNKIIIHFFRKM